jgi:hypothetical protein
MVGASSCDVTWRMRIREEWKVKRSSVMTFSRAPRIAGISASIVVFELGTMSPSR